ncbi:MAG: heme o synthase [Phycisphaerae bacterium]|nr:heme o synthase [Phycisphaerae bacterium]
MSDTVPVRSLGVNLRAKTAALVELTKPRIAMLVLIATTVGFGLGQERYVDLHTLARLLFAVLGTGLVACGANALNQLFEMEYDALMSRTVDRPLPSGRLGEDDALAFGAVLAASGLVLLAAFVNSVAAILAAASFLSYLLLYTPMKRISPTCVYIGAAPGALPPLIGWAGATGRIGIEGAVLFLIVFLWQMPHVAAIATLHRDDYARGGFRFLPVVDKQGRKTRRHVLSFGVLLLLASLLPVAASGHSWFYGVGAVLLGIWFLRSCIRFLREGTRRAARYCMLVSVIYLPLVLLLMLVDRTL